jgi:hypothetical protein
MERAVELFAAVQCVVIGLSHLTQPLGWVDFFVRLREAGRAGVFVNGFLSLGFGSIVVAFHNVWEGLPVVLTLLGWAQVVKAGLCFVAPDVGLRSLGRVKPERAREFVFAGVVLLALGVLFGYLALRTAHASS